MFQPVELSHSSTCQRQAACSCTWTSKQRQCRIQGASYSGEHVEESTLNRLTNANRRFSAILNLGGSSGSHLHLFGVQEIMLQHVLINAPSRIRDRRVSSPGLLEGVDSLASPANFFPSPFKCSEVESGGATAASGAVMLLSERGISHFAV
jgi:hypothetical protein